MIYWFRNGHVDISTIMWISIVVIAERTLDLLWQLVVFLRVC